MDFNNIVLDLFILAIFGAAIYAFLILPRQRQFRKKQQFVAELKVGTRVTTYSGIIGTVKAIKEEQGLIVLEIADGINVEILAAAVMGEFDADAVANSAKRAIK